ncbi:MAG: transcriptional regulator MntR [Verrucomicrobiales bacterium]|nr:transcriptional regulator MntR [Verrucomicrobiales bacterium]MDF1785758.1 transcriptional regulator MntR [Verrucomicrobiales bacterium]
MTELKTAIDLNPSTSVASEDYLEQILNLVTEKGYARVIDIATNLGISQASVSNMVQRLASEGLVSYEKYRGMALTPEGEKIAQAIIQRHEALSEFLRLFGLDELDIHRDVEGMEHHVSSPTLRVFQVLVEELQRRPKLVEKVVGRIHES